MFPLTEVAYNSIARHGVRGIPGYPFVPMDLPSMPPMGPDFVNLAKQLGGEIVTIGKGRDQRPVPSPLLEFLHWRALYDPYFTLPLPYGSRVVPMKLVPGHLVMPGSRPGPQRADVMIIGKHPGRDEELACRNFVGPTSRLFWELCHETGIPESVVVHWYVTNLQKFNKPDPNATRLTGGWLADCAPLTQMELQIVRPKYILCLGADACTSLTGENIESMKGRVFQYQYPVLEEDGRVTQHVAQLMAAIHPAQVAHQPQTRRDLAEVVSLFWQLLNGHEIGAAETDIDHQVIFREQELADIVDRILESEDPADKILAVDGEWEKERWDAPGAYLRTVQFSWKPKYARCVVLRHAGGAPAFEEGEQVAYHHLRRLFTAPGIRIGGSHLRADFPWLFAKAGIDIMPNHRVARTPELTRVEGGWDLSLMEHSHNETSRLGLETFRARYTTAPPYELWLDRWKKEYCSKNKLEPSELEGYGNWDGPEFYSYAMYDVDVPRRVFDIQQQLLDADRHGNSSRESFWRTHRCTPIVAEMEWNGILIDPKRVGEHAERFIYVRNTLLADLQKQINWPTFNPKSTPQKIAFLFGDRYAKEAAPPGMPTFRPKNNETLAEARTRVGKALKSGELLPAREGELHWVYWLPEGAQSLNLDPITSTGKRPKPWERVIADGEEDVSSPSTAKETLGIYGSKPGPDGTPLYPQVRQLRDIGFLNQALATTLRRPEIDKETGEYEVDENGEYVYERGLMSYLAADGRIHTRIRMTMETGRSSSRQPNLQAISSRREDDYRNILGFINKKGEMQGRYKHLLGNEPGWKYPMRSVFCASPGCLFMEADYTGAELAAIFWMAQDPQGIEDARRNALHEDDPDYSDIHSNSAVAAFRLQCAATKKALEDEGKSGLRTAAKNVNFGIPYQRGADAIARQCREEGVEATVDDARILIDYYFNRYKMVGPFLEACKEAVVDPGYIRGAFGRCRRFHYFPETLHDAQREACNFPIQNLVADAMWAALAKMEEWRWANPQHWFRFLLQIHDAALLEVPFESVPTVYRRLFRETMVDGVDIWPTDLRGNRLPIDKPYHLAVEQKMMFRWGEDLKDKDLLKLLKEDTPAADAQFIEALRELEKTRGYVASMAA